MYSMHTRIFKLPTDGWFRSHQDTNFFTTFDFRLIRLLHMITTSYSSNECCTYFGTTTILSGKFIHEIWIHMHSELETCTVFFFFWMDVCVVQTTISGQFFFLLFVRWRHLQHIWMNIGCIHVSNFSLILPRIRKCIVDYGPLYSFFVEKSLCREMCVKCWNSMLDTGALDSFSVQILFI